MNITRRNFIKFGTAAAFVGTGFLIPGSAAGQKTSAGSGEFPPEALADPFFYLTAEDFKRHLGTEFLLFSETGAIAAVLSDVKQVTRGKSNSRIGRSISRQPLAEVFNLSFNLPTNGLTQGTYRIQHPVLGEFDLFLVPERNDRLLLHAVINRV